MKKPPAPKKMPEQDPEQTDKSAKKYGPIAAIMVTLGAFFASQILTGILIGLFLLLKGKGGENATEKTLDSLSESTLGQFAFILIVEVFTLGFLYWFIRRRKIGYAEIGLGRRPKWSDTGWGALFFGLYLLLVGMTFAVVEKFVPSVNLDQEQQIGFESASGAGALALVFISLVILPPLVEEIMVRGFLYSGLRRRLGRLSAALLASLLFAVAHLQLGEGAPPLYVAAIDTFILSMLLIGLRERTGSIWSGILVHGMKNGLAFLALFVFHVA